MRNRLKQLIFIGLVFFCIQESAITAQVQSQVRQTPHVRVRLKATLSGHTQKIESISFSPDGELIATSSKDGTVRFWDSITGELKKTISGSDKDNWDEKRYEAIRDKYKIANDFPSVFTGPLKLALVDGEGTLAISPDGKSILTSKLKESNKLFDTPYFLSLWDLASGRLILTFEKLPNVMHNVHWSPDGKTIVLVGFGRYKARLLDATNGRIKAKLPYTGCDPDTFWGDDGCQAFVFNSDSSIFLKKKEPLKLWSSKTGELLEQLDSARLPFEFCPVDKHLLVTAGKDKRTVLLWEVEIN